MTDRAEPTWLPLEVARWSAIREAGQAVAGAAKRQERAIDALLGLAEDLCLDALARLEERGASHAQVERTRDAFARQRDALRSETEVLRQAIDGLGQELAER